MVRPTTEGSAPKRSRHKACESTATFSLPGSASASPNTRPRRARDLRVVKSEGVARNPTMRSGSPSLARLKLWFVYMAPSSKPETPALRSR